MNLEEGELDSFESISQSQLTTNTSKKPRDPQNGPSKREKLLALEKISRQQLNVPGSTNHASLLFHLSSSSPQGPSSQSSQQHNHPSQTSNPHP